MNDTLKYLIIVTLCYYLVKGLIYLLLWQATHKVEEKAREFKQKSKKHKLTDTIHDNDTDTDTDN